MLARIRGASIAVLFAVFCAALFGIASSTWAVGQSPVSRAYPPSAETLPGAAYIFQPGGTANAAAGVYTTWATLYAAAAKVRCPFVGIDSSISAATVPSGSYTFDCWTLSSVSTPNFSTLTFADGALVTLNVNLVVDGGLTIQTAATTAPTFSTPGASFPAIFLRGGSYMWNTSAATQPFVRAPPGGFVEIYGGEGSIIEVPPGGGTGTIVDVGDGGTGLVTLTENGNLGPYSLSGAGKLQVTWPQIAASVHASQDAGTILWYGGPPATATFAAASSLTGSTAAQNIPPSGTVTVLSSTDNLGTSIAALGAIGNLNCSFTGSASNTLGQTAAFAVFRNGSAVTGLSTSGTATTALAHAAAASLASSVLTSPNDYINVRLTTGNLVGALTDVMCVVGNNP